MSAALIALALALGLAACSGAGDGDAGRDSPTVDAGVHDDVFDASDASDEDVSARGDVFDASDVSDEERPAVVDVATDDGLPPDAPRVDIGQRCGTPEQEVTVVSVAASGVCPSAIRATALWSYPGQCIGTEYCCPFPRACTFGVTEVLSGPPGSGCGPFTNTWSGCHCNARGTVQCDFGPLSPQCNDCGLDAGGPVDSGPAPDRVVISDVTDALDVPGIRD